MLWIVSEWPPVWWLRSTLFWAARPRLSRLRIADAAAMARSRRELAELDDRLCDDIGITRFEAGHEAAHQNRDQLSPWAPLKLRMAVAESRRRFAPRPWLRATGRARLRG